jgi:hypothetical protein
MFGARMTRELNNLFILVNTVPTTKAGRQAALRAS